MCGHRESDSCFTHIIVFQPIVLTEGGQVRGGDQGPHRQAEGGNVSQDRGQSAITGAASHGLTHKSVSAYRLRLAPSSLRDQ